MNPEHFESVPSHNDAIFQNFALIFEDIKMIDWEVSGNADPFWDLSVLSAICLFTEEQNETLLSAYGVKDRIMGDYKMRLFTTLVHVQCCLWAFSKFVTKDFVLPETVLFSLYEKQLNLCKKLMDSNNFIESVDFLTL